MQVDLYESGTIAIVEAVSPELGNRVQRVRVQLPGTSQELLSKFREKKVDFAAHTATEDGGAVFLNLLGESCGLLYVKLPVRTFLCVVMKIRWWFCICQAWPGLQYCMYIFAHGFCRIRASEIGPICCNCSSTCCLDHGQQGVDQDALFLCISLT